MKIAVPNPVPSDQFNVSTEFGVEYVLENCTDHVVLSLRYPAQGYDSDKVARRLLVLADPQRTQPYSLRLGYDGIKYYIVAIRLGFQDYFPEDLGAAFDQLWSIASDVAEPAFADEV